MTGAATYDKGTDSKLDTRLTIILGLKLHQDKHISADWQMLKFDSLLHRHRNDGHMDIIL